jgi:hypothetical protein
MSFRISFSYLMMNFSSSFHDERRNKTFEIIWSRSNLCFTFKSNWDKYIFVLIRWTFNLFVFDVIIFVCLIMTTMTEWFVQMMIECFEIRIIWWNFLITHTTIVIFSFVDQYRFSVEMRILLKKTIDSTIVDFVISSRLKWYANASKSSLKTFTSIRNWRTRSKWVRNREFLKVF